MQVILKQDVAGIGRRGELKNVSDGHAINYLFPRGLALLATPQAVKSMQSEIRVAEVERKLQAELMAKNIQELDGKTITIRAKVGEGGHLFAGIHKEEIIHALKGELHLDIDADMIELEHPIKEIGTHKIKANKSEFEVIVEREQI